MINLDYAANTPVEPEVLSCFCKAAAEFPGNPNSLHSLGKAAKDMMQEITDNIAALLNCKPNEIIYTSGASEANNLAIKGLVRSYRHKGKHIISTCLEHSSVSGALTYLQEQGYEIELVDIKRDGTVDLDSLRRLIRSDTVLVSICMVDSELGTLQPISEIAEILKDYPELRFHVDAVQAVGKLPLNLTGIDCLSIAPHKFYGICGCGILIKRDGIILEPLIHGGTSTTIYRSGTPALALAAATEKALSLSLEKIDERYAYVKGLNEALRKALSEYPLVRINSTGLATPYILNISVKGVKAADFQAELDKRGVCISTKSACSVPNTASRPVYAVSGDKKNAMCSWRISLSHLTTDEEIAEFLRIFDEIYREKTK